MKTLCLTGDVMIGRGIDQALSQSCPPAIYESYVKDARGYIEIAERKYGPFQRPMRYDECWGAALKAVNKRSPVKRIINLETAVTTSEDWVLKGINYRAHPGNVAVLKEFDVDCAVLANNHMLDWGIAGLDETLSVLDEAGIPYVGAGPTEADAAKPVGLDVDDSKIWIAAYGHSSSGVPRSWQAGPTGRPGINVVPDLKVETAQKIGRDLAKKKKHGGDIAVLSIHWGPNWGYSPTRAEQAFAHALIDSGVDIVHGHSSHHPRPIEVYREKLILYGCGDFLNDYEGISGYETFRDDLVLAYFPTLSESGTLRRLEMVPFHIEHFRLNPVTSADAHWLADTLTREGRNLGTAVKVQGDSLDLVFSSHDDHKDPPEIKQDDHLL